MADRKISDLTALTAPASGDYLPIVDISEAAAANKNKRITIEELFRGVPLGTAAAPSIAIEGDENTGIYSPGADQVAISTNGTGRLFINSSGNVGIATSSPGAPLDVNGNIYGRNEIVSFSGATVGGIITTSAAGRLNIKSYNATGVDRGEIIFLRNNTGGDLESARIDSSGRLLVGTSSTSVTSTQILQGSSAGATSDAVLFLSRGTASPADGNTLGRISFSDNTYARAAEIYAQRDGGTWSASSTPARLVFSTTADGASSPTERARIDSSGNLLVGATSASKSGKLEVTGRFAALNSRETIQTGQATYTASTTATAVIELDNGGFYGVELLVTFADSSSPAGTIIQKVYVGTRGSGVNVTNASVSATNVLRETGSGGTFTDYFTWTVAVVSNKAQLSIAATQASGSGLLTVHSFGSPFTWLI